jgi:hypothetical protein
LKKYLSAFVCGFGAGVLQIVPVAKSFSCCLIIPAAAFLALVLEQKSTNNFTRILPGKAILIGLVTGLYAAIFGSFFDILITFITKNNDIVATFPEFQKMIADFPLELTQEMKDEILKLMTTVRDQITETGFSLLYSISVIFSNLFIDTIFGIIGGLVGAQILNNRNQK